MAINYKWVVKFGWKSRKGNPQYHFMNDNENVSCPRSGKVDTGYGTRTAVARFSPEILHDMCLYCLREVKRKGLIPI